MPCPSSILTISIVALAGFSSAQTYSATYLPSNAPPTTEEGQTGTNQCGTGSSQTSNCQNAYLNSLADWCVFAPPNPGPDAVIGDTERIEVSWCLQNGTGTRLIPDGAITGAHFIITPDFVQVTGIGDLTKLNIPAGDAGGELDPHGADGNGNPIGGLVFSNAFGQLQQMHEWTNFVAANEFCFRACKPAPQAPTFCQHIYDVMGCEWNMPGNYDVGFTSCHADSGEPMGVYGTSTFFQGQPATPAAHPAPASFSCTTLTTIGNGLFITTASSSATSPTVTANGSSSSASATQPSIISTPSAILSSSSSGSVSGQASAGSSTSGNGNVTPAGSSGSAPTRTGSSATRSVSLNEWERAIFSLGSAVIFSMLGAVFVL